MNGDTDQIRVGLSFKLVLIKNRMLKEIFSVNIKNFNCLLTIHFILGPDSWGSLREEWAIASIGVCQSPIDLSDAVPEEYDPLVFTDAYDEDIEGHFFNNGHTGKTFQNSELFSRKIACLYRCVNR